MVKEQGAGGRVVRGRREEYLAPLTQLTKLFGLWLSAALTLPACVGTEKKDPYHWPQSCLVLAYMGTLQSSESPVQTRTKTTVNLQGQLEFLRYRAK